MPMRRDATKENQQRDGRAYVTETLRDPVSKEVEQITYLADPGDNRAAIATLLLAHLEATRGTRPPSRVEGR